MASCYPTLLLHKPHFAILHSETQETIAMIHVGVGELKTLTPSEEDIMSFSFSTQR